MKILIYVYPKHKKRMYLTYISVTDVTLFVDLLKKKGFKSWIQTINNRRINF